MRCPRLTCCIRRKGPIKFRGAVQLRFQLRLLPLRETTSRVPGPMKMKMVRLLLLGDLTTSVEKTRMRMMIGKLKVRDEGHHHHLRRLNRLKDPEEQKRQQLLLRLLENQVRKNRQKSRLKYPLALISHLIFMHTGKNNELSLERSPSPSRPVVSAVSPCDEIFPPQNASPTFMAYQKLLLAKDIINHSIGHIVSSFPAGK